MSISDPIADALTRIKNAQMAGHESVDINTNTTISSILEILKNEGFIGLVTSFKEGSKNMVKVELKYYNKEPVIRGINKISKPGKRIYLQWKDIHPTLNNIGLSVISTPRGVMSGKDAKYNHVGGEYICRIW